MTTDPQPSAQLDREHAAEYGFVRLQRYDPASRCGLVPERSITHDIAGDTPLDVMLDALADFLRSAGYAIDGPLVVEEEEGA